MKKILLLTRPICPPWDEGSKNFAYTLAKHARNFEVHLLVCGKKYESLTYNWKSNFQENIVCCDIYTTGKWNWVQKMRAYLFLIKEFFLKGGKDYHIIHSFFTPTMLNTFALKLCLKNTSIKTIQTLATLRDDLYSTEKLKKIIYADFVITYSDYAKERLEKMGFQNVKRIYPGIDLEKFSPAPKKEDLMKKFNVTESDFVINYTGEYIRLGEIDDIAAVFSELARENKTFKLHLAVRVKNKSDAAKKEAVKSTFQKAGVLDRVAFIDDGSYVMEDIFNLCDISIFPARTMAGKFDVPLAVIEAMACGKPVIASNLERLKYFLNDTNCLLINPGDRQALKEKILYLHNNPEARDDLARQGLEFVRENFDIMKAAREYEKVYEEL